MFLAVLLKSVRRFCAGAVLALAIAALWQAHQPRAEGVFPVRPVRMIVPYPAGGPTDLLARKVANVVSPQLGVSMIVENRAGANGLVGTEELARSDPDGYTILMTGIEQHIGNRLMFKTLNYDPVRDFAPITQIDAEPLVLVVNPALPAHNVAELVALAKAKPGELDFASSSVGSLSHFAGEMLNQMAHIHLVHVPYKGGGPAMIDVLAGQVPIYFAGVNGALGHIQAGELRALALTSSSRLAVLPDVPTLAETPGLGEYEASIKFALWAPAKTPADVINKLNQAAVAGLRIKEFSDYLQSQGASSPIANTPEQMAANIASIEQKLPGIFAAAGIKAQ